MVSSINAECERNVYREINIKLHIIKKGRVWKASWTYHFMNNALNQMPFDTQRNENNLVGTDSVTTSQNDLWCYEKNTHTY